MEADIIVCRCCLGNISDEHTQSIFENNILDKLQSCANIEIKFGDGYPDVICVSCLEKVEVSYNFRQQCEDSDELMRESSIVCAEPAFDDESVKDMEVEPYCEEQEEYILDSPETELEETVFENASYVENDVSVAKEFTCFLCDEKYGNEVDLEKHQELTHVKFQKSDCRQPARTRADRPAVGQYQCTICLKFFAQLKSLTRHQKNKHKEWFETKISNIKKRYCCQFCEESFESKDSIRSHIRTDHPEVPPYECAVCSERFTELNNRNHHLKKYHRQSLPSCTICQKVFINTRMMRRHLKKIHEEQNETTKTETQVENKSKDKFQCQECGNLFTAKAGLQYHLRSVHRDERPFECSECHRKFRSKDQLNRHLLRIHNDDSVPLTAEFKCPKCEKTWVNKSSLKVHMRYHTGEKPFKCNICSKAFFMRSHLNNHVLTHSNDRPFSCPFCDKTYADATAKRTHILLYHYDGENNFECDVCGKRFPRAHLRNSHRWAHFNNTNASIHKKTKNVSNSN